MISLKKDSQRRREAITYLERHHNDFELFWGINGREIDRNNNPKISTAEEVFVRHNFLSHTTQKGRLSDGELGCAMSHLAVYEKIVGENLPGAIIIEDDFLAECNLVEVFSKCVRLLPDADVFSGLISEGNGLRLRIFPEKKRLGNGSYVVRDGIPGFDWFLNRRRRACNTACYYISNAACRRLIDIGYPVRFESDVLLGMVAYNKLRYYFISPQLGKRLDDCSSVGEHGKTKFY